MNHAINISTVQRVYFIGIGGIGMSALARYFNSRGVGVLGYDKTSSALIEEIQGEGIAVYLDDSTALCPADVDLVVYTPAISSSNKLLSFFRDRAVPLLKRSEALQLITKDTFNICIAGTHGKTTTSAMVAHVLRSTGYGCNAFLGGIATNYGTNFWSNTRPVTVIEADEFDRSFLRLHPDIISISSMDPDHLDIYGTSIEMENAFLTFVASLRPGGVLILRKGLKREAEMSIQHGLTYARDNGEADVHVVNLRIQDGAYRYSVVGPTWVLHDIVLHMGGLHNVENSLVAIAIAKELGINDQPIVDAIASFKGVKRRFESIVHTARFVFIDDYAHHPVELKALISSAKDLYPERHCTVVFQPHLYSRTRDFAAGFAESLDLADKVFLLPIYPARELPIEHVDSSIIAAMMKKEGILIGKEALIAQLAKDKPTLLITAGAGDIDQLVQPIKQRLESIA